MRHSDASDQERTQNVDIELSAIQFLGGLFDLVELVNAGVINDDIQAPEDIDGRVDQRFDFRLVRDIRAHGHGSSTSGFDVGNQLVRTALARCVIDNDFRAISRKLACNAGTDTFRGASDDSDLAF